MQPAVYHYFAEYGVQTTFVFATQDVTDTDDVYQGTAWAAGDAKLVKDGGAEASTTNPPARITAFAHSITLTATELQAGEAFVVIRDQTEPEVFEPVVIHVTTRLRVGQIRANMAQLSINEAAIYGIGNGTTGGVGIQGDSNLTGAPGILGNAATGNADGIRGSGLSLIHI